MCKTKRLTSGKYSNNYFISKSVEKLGITNRFIGYFYLVDILDLLINKGIKVNAFSKDVYPVVAAKYSKNACTVERDIRNVIDNLWDDVLLVKLTKFRDKKQKPSCCEFIYLLKNYVISKVV